MLTKTDFAKFKKLIKEEIVSAVEDSNLSLRAELKLTRMQIQTDIRTLSGRIKNLEQQSKKLDKKVDKVIDFFDHEHLELVHRVKRLESHLNLPTLADF